VFDLYADSSLDTQAALRILKQHPCVPSIALIRDSPYNVEALVELSRNGLWEVVCASDPSADLARVIREQVAKQTALSILRSFEPALGHVDFRLSAVLNQLFQYPSSFRSVADLCRAAGISQRRVSTLLHDRHLNSAKKFLNATRAVWAYSLLRHTTYPAREIASRLGWESYSQFAWMARFVFNARPSALRKVEQPNEVLMHVLERFCKSAPRRSADE